MKENKEAFDCERKRTEDKRTKKRETQSTSRTRVIKASRTKNKNGYKNTFFDDIQAVRDWKQKLDNHFHVVVTMPNASLLSQELGTKLTGRQITKELFPFTYLEFIAFQCGKTHYTE